MTREEFAALMVSLDEFSLPMVNTIRPELSIEAKDPLDLRVPMPAPRIDPLDWALPYCARVPK